MPCTRSSEALIAEIGDELELLKPATEGKELIRKTDSDDSEAEQQDIDSESDDDSSPEDISFSTSRASAFDRIHNVLEQLDDQKSLLKEKRRKRKELFESQKKHKLESSKLKRLPDDFLEELGERTPIEVKKSDVSETTLDELLGDTGSESEEEDMPVLKKRAVDLHAVSIKEEMLKTKSNAQTAAEFRQKMLYRNSIQRESNKARLSKAAKRKDHKQWKDVLPTNLENT